MKTIAAMLMLMLCSVATAQINKCIDKSGKVVGYGSDCPAGTRAEQSGIKTTPAPAASTAPGTSTAPGVASQQKSVAERDAEFRKRQMEKQESEAKNEKKSAEADQRRRACDDAQASLKSLEAGNRISRIDPKTGERSYLADADYPKEIENARRSVAANCK